MYIGWHVHKEVFNGTASFRNLTHLAHDINIKSQSQISTATVNRESNKQEATLHKQQQQQATSPQSPSVVAAHTG
jgi:hypothetical protein